MTESAVDDLGRRFGRWYTIVLVNWLARLNFGALNTLHYAVNALVAILLRWSVLLMLLQI